MSDALPLDGPEGEPEAARPAAPEEDGEPAPVPQGIEGADESLEPRHVHQIVSVRLGAGTDAIFVSRTETLIEHSHPLGEPGSDLWDEHARALGMSRPRPQPALTPSDAEDRADRRRRFRNRREGGPRSPGGGTGPPLMTFGSKSRLPGHLSRPQLEAYLKQERRIALEVRDPVAISYAAERYNTIMAFVQEQYDGDTIDLLKPILTVSQAAKILGYNAKEVRRLLGQGKINGRKVGSEWRIPLRAVL